MSKSDVFAKLPCQRCGEDAVLVGFLFPLVWRDVLHCRNCQESHYLRVTKRGNEGFEIAYYVYTLKYSLESYGDESDPPIGIVKTSSSNNQDRDDSIYLGVITIYPRKKYFNKAELSQIWNASNKKCHICKKSWRLSDRSLYGWHVDHVIPNANGRYGTELMKNFKVACAGCNLKKGRGQSQQKLYRSFLKLIKFLKEKESIANALKSRTIQYI